MSDQARVRMIKTMAPVEIPNGTLGTIVCGDISKGNARVQWDNGFYLPMFDNEIEVVNEA